MNERKVKGTMLVDHVRMIRGNKERNWNQYLKPEDWAVIKTRILASEWYPLELYKRCGWAAFNELAGGSTDLTRLRGKIRGKELFEGVYKSLIGGNDPMMALQRFVGMYSQLFNFSTLTFENAGANHGRIHHDYDPGDPANVPYCYQLMGHLDVLIEMSGGENVVIELITKQWEGAPFTGFDIRWQSSTPAQDA